MSATRRLARRVLVAVVAFTAAAILASAGATTFALRNTGDDPRPDDTAGGFDAANPRELLARSNGGLEWRIVSYGDASSPCVDVLLSRGSKRIGAVGGCGAIDDGSLRSAVTEGRVQPTGREPSAFEVRAISGTITVGRGRDSATYVISAGVANCRCQVNFLAGGTNVASTKASPNGAFLFTFRMESITSEMDVESQTRIAEQRRNLYATSSLEFVDKSGRVVETLGPGRS